MLLPCPGVISGFEGCAYTDDDHWDMVLINSLVYCKGYLLYNNITWGNDAHSRGGCGLGIVV